MNCSFGKVLEIKSLNSCAVEPRSTDTRLIQTQQYEGQLTRLLWALVNTDTLAYPLGVHVNAVPL